MWRWLSLRKHKSFVIKYYLKLCCSQKDLLVLLLVAPDPQQRMQSCGAKAGLSSWCEWPWMLLGGRRGGGAGGTRLSCCAGTAYWHQGETRWLAPRVSVKDGGFQDLNLVTCHASSYCERCFSLLLHTLFRHLAITDCSVKFHWNAESAKM